MRDRIDLKADGVLSPLTRGGSQNELAPRRRSKISLSVAIALLTTPAATLIPQSPAIADTDDPIGTPDDNPHSYCWGANLDNFEKGEINDQMLWTENNTDVVKHWDSTCAFGSGDKTDMHMMDVNIPELGVRGQAFCTSHNLSGSCNRFDVQLDTGEIGAQGGPYTANVRKTICHEIGHTLGLDHYSKNPDWSSPVEGQHDCMISGATSDNVTWRTYGEHHINDHINPEF